MKKKNYKVEKILQELFKNGYCVVSKVLTEKKSNSIIKHLEKLEKKTLKNKNFFDEASHRGQLAIRDLPLRNPNHFLELII